VVSATDPHGRILGFLDRSVLIIYIYIYKVNYTYERPLLVGEVSANFCG
jgi:hypothetical protein